MIFRRSYPNYCVFDGANPRLFALSLKRFLRDPFDGKWYESRDRHLDVITAFFSKEKGVMLSDSFTMAETHQSLIGCSVPFLFFSVKSNLFLNNPQAGQQARETAAAAAAAAAKKDKEDESDGEEGGAKSELGARDKTDTPKVDQTVMREFAGCVLDNPMTLTTMKDFAYHLMCGNMEAFFSFVRPSSRSSLKQGLRLLRCSWRCMPRPRS